MPLIKIAYLKYPKVYELMKKRHITYNRTLDYIEELNALYEMGYRYAERRYEEILTFLKV